jgi:mono/diheme cytochrome c family protein
MNKRRYFGYVFFMTAIGLSVHIGTGNAQGADEGSIEQGRYMVKMGGCNDCHTAGFLLSEGTTPEDLWLMGDTLGWRGPWGTTYGKNLRITLQAMTEDDWVVYAKNLKTLPPMPWFTLNQMRESDLRSVYKYIRTLGPGGELAPLALPPGEEPTTPYAVIPGPPEE